MDHIEIIVPDVRKRRRDDEILTYNNTMTFYNVTYTPELVVNQETLPMHTLEPKQCENDSSDSDDDVANDMISVDEFYHGYVARTVDQCYQELLAPQRSLQWLQARAHCITASSFGAAVGHNPYCTPDDIVIEKLWQTFIGNEYTQYGTFHEPDARNSLIAALQGPLYKTLINMYKIKTGIHCDEIHWDLFETGLLKAYQQPWMAVSPDGLLRLSGPQGPVWLLVEYKCPAKLRDSSGHPYAKWPYNVPEYYMDQIQGIMGLLNKFPHLLTDALRSANLTQDVDVTQRNGPVAALFVVWQPRQMHVTLLEYNDAYYKTCLEPSLSTWYFTKYLPMAVLKHNEMLIPGTLKSSVTIEL